MYILFNILMQKYKTENTLKNKHLHILFNYQIIVEYSHKNCLNKHYINII